MAGKKGPMGSVKLGKIMRENSPIPDEVIDPKKVYPDLVEKKKNSGLLKKGTFEEPYTPLIKKGRIYEF